MADPSHVIDHEPIVLDASMSYEETPVEIQAFEQNVLRNKTIRLVKVLWRNQVSEEATWERDDDMRAKYPQLFT